MLIEAMASGSSNEMTIGNVNTKSVRHSSNSFVSYTTTNKVIAVCLFRQNTGLTVAYGDKFGNEKIAGDSSAVNITGDYTYQIRIGSYADPFTVVEICE